MRTPPRPSNGDDAHTVTLITGDCVTIRTAGSAPLVQFDPGPGRADIGFVTLRRGDDITVIPKAWPTWSPRIDSISRCSRSRD